MAQRFLTDGVSELGSETTSKKARRPRQTYKPTQDEIDVALERGKKAEAASKQKKIRSLVAGLTEQQMEGLRAGENFVGWNSEKKTAYYGTPQSTLKPGRNRIAEIQGRSTSFRPQRAVSEDLSVLGIPGMGMAGVIGIGAKKGGMLTGRMAKELNQLNELKTLDDLPEAFTAQQVSDRSRKLFNKNPKQLNKEEQAVIWIDLVDNSQSGKRVFAPAPAVTGPRAVERTQAAEKLSEAQRRTARTEESAGRAATLGKEAGAAEAAGTLPIAPVKAAPKKQTGAQLDAPDDKGVRARLRSQAAAKEAAEIDVNLSAQIGGTARPKTTETLAGARQSDADIGRIRKAQAQNRAVTQRRAATRADKQKVKDANLESKKIKTETDSAGSNLQSNIKNSDVVSFGVDDIKEANELLDAMRTRLAKVAYTASDQEFKAARSAVRTFERDINSAAKRAKFDKASARSAQRAAAKEGDELAEAVQRRSRVSRLKVNETIDAENKKFLALYNQKSSGDSKFAQKKRLVTKRAEAIANRPLGELTAVERERFIGQAWRDVTARKAPKAAREEAVAAGQAVKPSRRALEAERQRKRTAEKRAAFSKDVDRKINVATTTAAAASSLGLGAYYANMFNEAEKAEQFEQRAMAGVQKAADQRADKRETLAAVRAQAEQATQNQPWKSGGDAKLPSNWLDLYVRMYTLPQFAARRDGAKSLFQKFQRGTQLDDPGLRKAGLTAARKDFLELVNFIDGSTKSDLFNVTYESLVTPDFDVDAIIERIK